MPTSRKITKDENGKNNIIKYSIKDSQNSFILFHTTISNSEDHLEKLRAQKLPIQPFIIVISTLLKPDFDNLFHTVSCF